MNKPPRWRFLVEMPTAYNPSSRPDGMQESAWGRTWTLERDDGKRAVVEIETNQAALDAYVAGTLPKAARLAIQTEGRSALEEKLGNAKLPSVLHITGAGIRRHR
jgi:hypothetical protein